MSRLTKQSNPIVFQEYETQAKQSGLRFILGLDEAGRGPLAGPVVAAAVSLKDVPLCSRIDDSKKLTAKQRETAFDEILERSYVGIGVVSEEAIDELNILNASFHAMELAVMQLWRYLPQEEKFALGFIDSVLLLVDGNMFRSQLPFKYKTIVGGDRECLSIACASIVAKVYRDRLMFNYDKIYPQYGFAAHKGYPTPSHRQAIAQYGPCRIHRKSFTF